MFIPFLISRQIICGAGKVVATAHGASFAVSQRADHIWEGVSSATTRSRPIINTRDEPHADAEKYRRLHVIVGDSNMSETTTLLKVGSADLVLRMIEAGVVMRDLTMENPIRAIRTMSHDPTGRATVRLANGRELSALDMQREYLDKALEFVDREGMTSADTKQVLDLWGRALDAIGVGRPRRHRHRDRLGHQAPAHRALPRASTDSRSPTPACSSSTSPTTTSTAGAGLFYLLQRHGRAARVATDVEIFQAKVRPPQTTRAKLRGDFIRAAQAHGRDFTVDWVHLKLNDQAQRTVLCKDPFRAVDDRVERLMDTIERSPSIQRPL